jgi:hypothetical protein
VDIGDNGGQLRGAVGLRLVVDEYPDRPVELADAIGARADLHLGVEGDLEEAVLDFIVVEFDALGRTPACDL